MKNKQHAYVYRMLATLLVAIVASLLVCGTALAGEVVYRDDEKQDLDDPNTTYIIRGDGTQHKSGNYFSVPRDKSSEEHPITIILENVNRTQEGCNPGGSFINIWSGNYVIVKLRGENYVKAGEQSEAGPNDGMAVINVPEGSTMKLTSDSGDGSTDGSLTAIGGGGKYGGSAIGREYYYSSGDIIIAGGTINATGGHCAAGIGSGRDGECKSVTITGGDITAQGGEYAAGIGGGDNVSAGMGGDTYNITISGGTINAMGGANGAGIGCSEGGKLHGTILISGGTVTATGGHEGAGIGSGDGGSFANDDGEKGLVKITGGTINATGGGNGAGIGGANGSDHIHVQIDEAEGAGLSIKAQGGENGAGIGSGAEDCDEVSIRLHGGTIEARGGSSGAGIGGANDPGVGTGGDAKVIEIYGTGTVNAYGGSNAAAIGGGYDNEVSGHITIEGDYAGDKGRGLTIVADSGGGTSAGIGSGSEDCGPITIKNANVKAWGDNSAADIGTGGNWGNGGKIDYITIENCSINTYGKGKTGAGIGAGHGCECRSITIKDSECYGNAIGEGMGVYFKFWDNYGDMDSITIENSHIEASWDRASGSGNMKGSAAAGIGSCTLGCVHSISISNSTVTAKGINGGAGIGSGGWGADNFLGLEYTGGEVGSISIKNSQVTAIGAEPGVQTNKGTGPDLTPRPVIGGGAGIGGGGNTKCGTITIADSTVTAKAGKYAAGIGGGGSESVDAVDISNSMVTATGGQYGAGIGSGGSTSAVTTTVFRADVDTIKISDSTVTATGGQYSAGIGTGCSGAMDTTTADGEDIDYNIRVTDSTINAQGGEGGAGIGGGMVGAYATGGHSGDILLEGTSRITAKGGKQGSGVGGGASSDYKGHGGCDKVVIDLTSADAMAQDTDGCDQNGIGWLVATGGLGGAGIGAGGYLYHKSTIDPIPYTNDTQSIEIKGGYVRAQGGGDDKDDAGIATGSGAGIGGGAAGTRLKDLTISGGWVEAHAGDEHAADIGHGGAIEKRDGADDTSNRFYVSGGTVSVERFGAEASKVFDGGSIRTSEPVSGAHNSVGTPVFKTSLKMRESTMARVQASVAGIGSTNVYADDESMIYLYLPESQTDKQTSSVKEHPDTAFPLYGDYYGTTTIDGTGWLKMKGQRAHFEDEPDWQHYGDEVTLTLYDDEGIAGAKWKPEDITVSGVAELVEVVNDTSPSMQLKLRVTGVGSYHVEAFSASDDSDPLYWGSQASYDMTTIKVNTTIDVTSSSSKTYDGEPIDDPSFQTNGTGEVTITYQDADGNVLTEKPVQVGSYTATIRVAETEVSTAAEKTVNISIWPIKTTTVVSLSQNNAQASASATVLGLDHGGAGTVTLVVKQGDQVIATSEPVSVSEQAIVATATFEQVAAGEYVVEATFAPSDGNHEGSTGSATGKKDLATRTISGQTSYTKTYGDPSFDLGLTASAGSGTWSYEVVWDSFAGYGREPAVAVDSAGSVSIKHAGTSVIKATLSDNQAIFYDATALVRVAVGRKGLTVRSFAYLSTDAQKDPVTTVTYGDTSGLSTDLSYEGLEQGDTPAAIGTLAAMPLPPVLGVTPTDVPYTIPILRNGEEVTVGENTSRVFASRDYDITYECGTLAITRRKLAVQALDAGGVYGGDAPDYRWDVASNQQSYGCGGLAPCDSRDMIFTEEPTVELNGGEYQSLNVGTHEGVLQLQGGTSANYEVIRVSGNLVIDPALLSDKERFNVSVQGTVYNGSQQEQPVTVYDTKLEKQLMQGEDIAGDYVVSYVGDTTNAGRVWAVVGGKGNYAGFQTAPYLIAKKLITVETESATKRYDGTPLTADGVADGILDQDATLRMTGTLTVPGSAWNSYSLDFKDDIVAADYRAYEKLGVLRVRGNFLARCEMSQPDNVTYDGKEHKAVVKITDGDGNPLVEGTDYDLTYTSTADNLTDAGTVTVTATGKGIYAFDWICISGDERDVSDEVKRELSTKSVTYVIRPAQLIVDTEEAEKVYDGTPLTAPGSVEGLVNAESATVKTTGSQTEVGSSKNTYKMLWDGTAKEENYQVVHEDLGTLTVNDAGSEAATDVKYTCVKGDGGTWIKGSGKELTFIYKRSEDDEQTFSHFQYIEVDGKEIDASAFDAQSGSLVVSLKASYLEGLSLGKHTLRARFDDGGSQRATFTVTTPAAAAAARRAGLLAHTADASPSILALLLCALCLAAAGFTKREYPFL